MQIQAINNVYNNRINFKGRMLPSEDLTALRKTLNTRDNELLDKWFNRMEFVKDGKEFIFKNGVSIGKNKWAIMYEVMKEKGQEILKPIIYSQEEDPMYVFETINRAYRYELLSQPSKLNQEI